MSLVSPTARKTPLVIGHRGAPCAMPENTLEGFEHALEAGADGLELDVLLSRDGVPMVTHNPRLMADTTRDKSGRWLEQEGPAISDLTAQELSDFNVGGIRPGSAYGASFPNQVTLPKAAIPTLDAALHLAKNHKRQDIRVIVEIKHSPICGNRDVLKYFVETVTAAIARHDLIEQSYLHAFDWAVLDVARTVFPSLRRSYLSRQPGSGETGTLFPDSPWLGSIAYRDVDQSVPRLICKAGGRAWSPWHGDLTDDDRERAQQLDVAVFPWTVNAEDDLQEIMTLGVDGVITDNPELAVRVRGQIPVGPGNRAGPATAAPGRPT